MQFFLDTYRRPVSLKVTIATRQPQKMRIIVSDYLKPDTKYLNRFNTVIGSEMFILKLPQTSDRVKILIYNEKVGNTANGNDSTFQITERKIMPLITKLSLFDYTNSTIKNFIRFSQEFSDTAGILSTNTIYLSNNNQFKINYLPVIRSLENGKTLNTPARISKGKGVIEVSKEKFAPFTVAGRMAILLHEFSHYYMNLTMQDEEEADYHAINIYLALGYPSTEILNVFTEVFMRADTISNRKRLDKLIKYVYAFEKSVLNIAVA